MSHRSLYGWLIGVSIITGCSFDSGLFGVDRCADISCGSVPAPAGHYVCAWENAQVGSAVQDQLVFYQREFIGDTEQLGPHGQTHLAQLLQQGFALQQPLIVEASGDETRDLRRVVSLSQRLGDMGVPVPPNMITTGIPPAIGLSGQQAEGLQRVNGSSMQNNRSSSSTTTLGSGLMRGVR